MINDEKLVRELAIRIKENIINKINFGDALNMKDTLIRQKETLEVKIIEYSTRKNDLIKKVESLGNEIAAAISNAKNPDAPSKKLREIENEIFDLNTWIEESEKLIITIKIDVKKSIELIHSIVLTAVEQEKIIMVHELNADLRKIEDKIESWIFTCGQLSDDFEIPNINKGLFLKNEKVSKFLPRFIGYVLW